jgi:hypothetical protein
VKRIAAVAALLVTMLAVPAAAAMASTVGSGPDYPGQGQFVCPPPFLHRPHFRHLNRYRHHHPRRNFVCSVPLPFQQQQYQTQQDQNCPSGYAYGQAQSFTFSVASGSSTVYEDSGPTLTPAEEFSYDGSTYTIWSINPGDDSFTMSVNGSLYVNSGPDINGATGNLFCSG